MVDFSDASLTTEADTDFGGAVVYSSATSMFAGPQQIPPAVYAFLAHRNLPLPRQDQMFASGFKVVIRERVVAPGTQLWFAPTDDGLVFDLGSIAGARLEAAERALRSPDQRRHPRRPRRPDRLGRESVSVEVGPRVLRCSRPWLDTIEKSPSRAHSFC